MIMWLFILLGMAAAGIGGMVFVVNRLTRFPYLRTLPRKRAILLSVGILAILLAVLLLWGGLWNTMIVFIHLLLIWLLCDGVFALLKRKFSRYYAGMLAILLTVVYMGWGYYNVHHVVRTAYTVDMAQGEPLRIVGFSDSHTGTTFHADKFLEYVARINAENPDIIVIPGDFVDDGTSLTDMAQSCRALSQLKATYGVYFVYGNHDCGYYNTRGYGKAELAAELMKAGIVILEDETVPIAGSFFLTGRQDSQVKDRASMASLMAPLPEDSCVIVLDHEPNDYAAEAEAGAGLVISGHTHGGQFFPILKAGEWIGANDFTYGYLRRGNTNFIVSSGISNWAFQFKTGCVSEYFVIDVH